MSKIHVLVLFLAACEEEAIVHAPPPPSVPVAELGAPPQKEAAPATAPVADAPKKAKETMTMETFMEDYIEPEMKKAVKAKGRSEALEALLTQLPAMMPDDPKFAAASPQKSWAGIVEASLKGPKYGQSCKSCHALWKKPYKKAYRDRTVEVELKHEQ